MQRKKIKTTRIRVNATSSSSPTQPLRAWLLAARPRTLALAWAGVGLGILLAAARFPISPLRAALTLLTATLLQILSNFANDYGDSRHGIDNPNRVGPKRAVQSGLISSQAMLRAVIITALLAMVSGSALLLLTFGWESIGWMILFLGVGGAAVWAAIAYTATRNPYGYIGLGDLMVFLFFGWVAVLGTYGLFSRGQYPHWFAALLPATSIGLLATGVLNINNIRDRQADQAAGKITIPVRLGDRWARRYHYALLGGAILCATLCVLLSTQKHPLHWLYLIAAVGILWHGYSLSTRHTPAEIDPLLRQLSLLTFLLAILLGIGIWIG